MSLANGREYLAIPGPSVMPDRVLRAMHRASPNIYEGEIVDITASARKDLCALARTSGSAALYIANGHGVWEAALANVLSRGDRVLVLNTGRFAEGWGMVAGGLGARVETLDFGKSSAIDPARVEERLRADRGHEIRAVLAVQVDTATSVRNDLGAVRAAMDAAGHPALLMGDCVASLACERFEMDASGVDVMVAGSQKGLMTPAGIGVVFANDRAREVRATADCVTGYWDWQPRMDPEYYYQVWCGTAATHHIYGLREALDMIAEEGIETVWDRHARLARGVWAAVDAWGQGGEVKLNVTDPSIRSHAVTTIFAGQPLAGQLRQWVSSEGGLTLGIGLGMESGAGPRGESWFRIGHMGHVNAHMVLGALGVIEAGLKALQVPHGGGAVEAAAAAMLG